MKILVDQAVIDQALDALEHGGCPPDCNDGMTDSGGVHPWGEAALIPCPNCQVITALRQAKADAALDRMAENERELGIQMQPDVDQRSTESKETFDQPEPVAWVDLLKDADKIVRGKVLWKRFIDGTPLANDIAVWMADFAQQHTSPPPRQPETDVQKLQDELKSAKEQIEDLQQAISFLCRTEPNYPQL